MMAEHEHTVRREAIRRIIRAQRVSTQEDLRRELAKEGILATQATISRDLARLKARRVSLPEGGTTYELEEAPVSDGEAALAGMRDLVTGVNESDSLVVVNTLPGAASMVGVQIDRARVPGVLGTIAGDDTIFVAPARGVSTGRLAKQLKSIWKGGRT